jgi:putative transposase
MRYCFIHREKGPYPLTVLCQVLAVSRSGYYALVRRELRGRTRVVESTVVAEVRRVHLASRRTYGQRRLCKALQAQGYAVGRRRTRTLMQQAGVQVRRRRPWRPRTTDSQHPFPVAPNHLKRQFTVEEPNRVWASDLTYIPTQEGWLYLALVVDLFSRKVVGWALATTLEPSLVEAALQMAIGRRHPLPGLLHHSDRGSQYASPAYQALLERHQMHCSMSRRGNCWDNAVVERVIGSLKREGLPEKAVATQGLAKALTIDYLEMFYNSHRRHSTLGYLSPNAFETQAQGASESKTAQWGDSAQYGPRGDRSLQGKYKRIIFMPPAQ